MGSKAPKKSSLSVEKSSPLAGGGRSPRTSSSSVSSKSTSKSKDETDKWIEQELLKAKQKGSSSDGKEGKKEKEVPASKSDTKPTKNEGGSKKEEIKSSGNIKKEEIKSSTKDVKKEQEIATSNKKSESDNSGNNREVKTSEVNDEAPKSRNIEKPPPPEEDDYAEDFEEYEDDFEQEDEEEEEAKEEKTEAGGKDEEEAEEGETNVIPAIAFSQPTQKPQSPERPTSPTLRAVMAAMDAENAAAVLSSHVRTSNESSPISSPPQMRLLPQRKVVELRSSKPKLDSANRIKRARELSMIISFESVAFELLDLPPQNEYELYIRQVGKTDTSQKATQTQDNYCDRDMQTSLVQKRTRGVQAPYDGTVSGDVDPDGSYRFQPLDTLNLGKFLRNTTPVCEILLDENLGDQIMKKFTFKSDYKWSTSYLRVHHEQLLQGRTASHVTFSPLLPHHTLVMYGPIFGGDGRPSSLVCLWNLDKPDTPSRVLIADGILTSVAIVSRHIVVAGSKDGSVLVWDLRESDTVLSKQSVETDSLSIVMHYHTYSTDGLKEAHQATICRVIGMTQSNSTISNSGTGANESESPLTESSDPLDQLPVLTDEEGVLVYKVATLDVAGVVNIWVISELPLTLPDREGVGDIHLAFGGCLRVAHTSTISLGNPVDPFRVFDLAFHPQDPSRVLVGSDTGRVLHGVRFGHRVPPREYLASPVPVDVCVIACSPHTPGLFVVGCSDGSVALMHTDQVKPLFTWERLTSPIISAHWSTKRCSVFFAATSTNIYIWDILTNTRAPIIVETWNHTSKQIAVEGDLVAIAHEKGHVDVHICGNLLTNQSPADVTKFSEIISSLT